MLLLLLKLNRITLFKYLNTENTLIELKCTPMKVNVQSQKFGVPGYLKNFQNIIDSFTILILIIAL